MRRIALAFIPVLLLIASGCGAQSTPTGSGTKFSSNDLSLNIGGAAYSCNMNIEEVVALLGEDYTYEEAISCAYDGLDKTYQYSMATFFTNPLEEGDIVIEIFTADPQVTTSREIAVGASREDVITAYGEPSSDTPYQMVYQLDGERGALCFDMQDGVVASVYITLESV